MKDSKAVSRRKSRNQRGRKRTVRLELPNGHLLYVKKAVADWLVSIGVASVQIKRPPIYMVIALERIGAAFIPGHCRHFIEEFKQVSGYRFYGSHRTRKPRHSVQRHYVEEGYVSMPLGS